MQTLELIELIKSDPTAALHLFMPRNYGSGLDGGLLTPHKLHPQVLASGVYVDLVNYEGGYEGGGENVVYVFAFKLIDSGIIIECAELTGNYDSWNGTAWDQTARLVYPKEIMTTIYVHDKPL
jgi:hypothetical protein